MGSTPHTSCRQGTPVSIRLKDGRQIEGKFKERTGNFVELYDGQRIRAGEIRSFVIRKPRPRA